MNNPKENLLRELLTQANLEGSITDVVELTPPGEKRNEIFLIHTKSGGYVLKALADQDALIGEETEFDIIYDSKIHELVAQKHPAFAPPRKLISVDYTSNNALNKPFVIQSLIEGKRIDDEDVDVNDQAITEVLNIMIEYYQNSQAHSEYGYVAPAVFNQNEIELKSHFKDEVDNRKNQEQTLGFANYATRYFEADVKREVNLPRKDDLLSYLTNIRSKLDIEKYHLIHADLKPSNFLVDGKNVHIFDWSRAHFGDTAVDFADIILSKQVYVNTKSAIEVFKFIEDQVHQYPSITSPSNFEERIRYYISLMLFSIARIFYPECMKESCAGILSPASTLIEFLEDQSWIEKKYF